MIIVMPSAEAVILPVYLSVPSKVISPVPVMRMRPVQTVSQVALLSMRLKLVLRQLWSAAGGGCVHTSGAQNSDVCGGGVKGMPGIFTCEVVIQRTPSAAKAIPTRAAMAATPPNQCLAMRRSLSLQAAANVRPSPWPRKGSPIGAARNHGDAHVPG